MKTVGRAVPLGWAPYAQTGNAVRVIVDGGGWHTLHVDSRIQPMLRRRWMLGALVLAVGGCVNEDGEDGLDDGFDDGADDDAAEDCVADGLPSSTDGLPTRTLSIGSADGVGTFQAWKDGDPVDFVFGFQGSQMITPHLRVEGVATNEASPCWAVELAHLTPDGAPLEDGTYRSALVFSSSDDAHETGPIFDELYSVSSGDELQLDATVLGHDFVASTQVTVTLR